jgi:ATP-dependent helicase IRC3
VFAVNVEHAKNLQQAFLSQNVLAECLVGSTPFMTRFSLMEQYRNGKIPVMINCGILTEGTDVRR